MTDNIEKNNRQNASFDNLLKWLDIEHTHNLFKIMIYRCVVGYASVKGINNPNLFSFSESNYIIVYNHIKWIEFDEDKGIYKSILTWHYRLTLLFLQILNNVMVKFNKAKPIKYREWLIDRFLNEKNKPVRLRELENHAIELKNNAVEPENSMVKPEIIKKDEKIKKPKSTAPIKVDTCTYDEIMTVDGIDKEKAELFIKLRNDNVKWYDIESFAQDLGLFNPLFLTSDDVKRLVFPSKPTVKAGRKLDF